MPLRFGPASILATTALAVLFGLACLTFRLGNVVFAGDLVIDWEGGNSYWEGGFWDDNSTIGSNNEDCEGYGFYYYSNGEKIWQNWCDDESAAQKIQESLTNEIENGKTIVPSLKKYINPDGVDKNSDTDPSYPDQAGYGDPSGSNQSGTTVPAGSIDPANSNSTANATNIPANNVTSYGNGQNQASTVNGSSNTTQTPCAGNNCSSLSSSSNNYHSNPNNNSGQTGGSNNPGGAPGSDIEVFSANYDNLPDYKDPQTTISISANQSYIDLKIAAAADNVYFYIEGSSAVPPTYLGRAVKNGDYWEYRVDLDKTPLPNGNYSVWAQVIVNGIAYRIKKMPVDISMAFPTETLTAEDIKKQILQASGRSDAIKAEIEQAINDFIVKIGLLDQKGRSEFSDIVREYVQLIQNREMVFSMLEKEKGQTIRISIQIEKIAAAISQLPSNAIPLVKEDKQAQLDDLNGQLVTINNDIKKINSIALKNNGSLAELRLKIKAYGINQAIPDEILNDFENKIGELEKEIIQINEILILDFDDDGLRNQEEYRIGTNPTNPDTDGDGILDGDEYANGYDPLKVNRFPNVKYHSPKTIPPRKTNIYRFDEEDPVSSVELPDGSTGVRFKGWGLPDSYVTLFIYSDPTIVMVKTDRNGRWTYTLDKPVENGMHLAYAAQTDSFGYVKARSEVMIFVKDGNSVDQTISNQEASLAAAANKMQKGFGWTVTFLIIITTATAIIIVGHISRQTKLVNNKNSDSNRSWQ